MKRAALALLLSVLAAAAAAQHQHPAPQAVAKPGIPTEMSDGVVRGIDRKAGRITLKHGEIPNIHMGPMTMVFAVKSPALLDKLAEGDKVRFRVESAAGDFVVTAIEKAK